jgi:hypothetical protein
MSGWQPGAYGCLEPARIYDAQATRASLLPEVGYAREYPHTMASTEVAAWIAAVTATAAAIGTVGSVVYQARQFRDQRNLLQRQSEVLGLQAEDLRDATTYRQTQQAALVRLDTWMSRLMPKIAGDKPPTAGYFPHRADEGAVVSSVRVCNDSAHPIRRVQVRFDSADARWVRLNDSVTVLSAPLAGLGPAQSVWFDSDYQRAYIGSVTLRFTDVNGHHWQTSMTGYAERIGIRDW